jgi:hypothetical protein
MKYMTQKEFEKYNTELRTGPSGIVQIIPDAWRDAINKWSHDCMTIQKFPDTFMPKTNP